MDSQQPPLILRPGTRAAAIEAATATAIADVERALAGHRAALDAYLAAFPLPDPPSPIRSTPMSVMLATTPVPAPTCDTPRCGGEWNGDADFIRRRLCRECAALPWYARAEAAAARADEREAATEGDPDPGDTGTAADTTVPDAAEPAGEPDCVAD